MTKDRMDIIQHELMQVILKEDVGMRKAAFIDWWNYHAKVFSSRTVVSELEMMRARIDTREEKRESRFREIVDGLRHSGCMIEESIRGPHGLEETTSILVIG